MLRSSRRALFAGAGVIAVVAVAVMLTSVSVVREDAREASALYRETPVAGEAASTEVPSVRQTPGAPSPGRPAASRFASPVHRMRVERLGVDAPLVTLGVDRQGVMEAPADPGSVGWYDFTARPGLESGNAVFAGHRDSRQSGPAVFWDLHRLQRGDIVEVELVDGSRLRYAVTAAHTYPVEDMDMREILAPTERATLTLITCAGRFEGGAYSDRHVVRATRVSEQAGR